MANVAVITNCWNEAVNLPRWIRYYGGQFGQRNLFVLDDGSDDGSTDGLGEVSVIRLPKAPFSDRQRQWMVTVLSRVLLSRFDALIYSDCDEIIIPDPQIAPSLAAYADRFVADPDAEIVTCIGLNVLHHPDEPELDPARPILGQRRHVEFAAGFCKPLLMKVALQWTNGFHFCNRPPRFDHLYLFHMKFMDMAESLARHRLNRLVHPDDKEQGIWRLSDKEFESTFRRRLDRPVSEDFDLTEHQTAFLAGIVETENGWFARTQPMPRIPHIYRIPERFAGIV